MRPDWAEAGERILTGTARRVLVLGPADAGKSSFCRLLLDAAAKKGRTMSLIDSDPGQKMVGPPTAITCSASGAPDLLAGLAFVGATDPAQGFSRVIAGTRQLLDGSRSDLIVVNTSGLVAGIGRRLKAEKIAALRPDLIVAIGGHPAVDAILADHPNVPPMRLPRSQYARRKTDAQRRAAREKAFQSYFEGAPIREMEMRTAGPSRAGLVERLLIGLRDAQERDRALGIVLKLEPEINCVRVLSPDLPGRAEAIVPGILRLGPDFKELPRSGAIEARG